MKNHRRLIRSAHLGSLAALCALSPLVAQADTPSGVLGTFHDYILGCANNGTVYRDVTISQSQLGISNQHYGSSFVSGSVDSCSDFTYFSRPMYNKFNNNVYVGYAGPAPTTAGDCGHSTISYVVMKKFNSGSWDYVASGMVFGKWSNNKCTYSYSAAAASPSTQHIDEGEYGSAPWVSVNGGNGSGTTQVGEIIVAAYSWAHNDTNIGHTGNLCGSASCYGDSFVIAW